MKKNYIVDTNIFLDNHNCIEDLINHEENNVYIPERVILELDKLKGVQSINHLVYKAIESIEKNINNVSIINKVERDYFLDENEDYKILFDIQHSKITDPILVTNDRLFRIVAKHKGIEAQEYLNSLPYKSESEIYTGFLEKENLKNNPDKIKNYFYWNDKGKVLFKKHNKKELFVDRINEAWHVKPRTVSEKSKTIDIYQNAALELLLDNDIKLLTLQGPPGGGKSLLALAAALELVFVKKQFEKIVIVKPIIEMGDKLGFLPGDENEKIQPHIDYINSHIDKLMKFKETKLLFKKGSKEYDPSVFKIMPMSFLRGADLENTFLIIEEAQNASRDSMRTILTRLGYNTKCVITGDTNQVDNPSLNKLNNGINWTVKYMKSSTIFAHLYMKCKRSRGPIAEAVIESGL
jgi:PhoH-like ATPase